MTSMFVPEPVMSLAITPKKSKKGGGSDTADKFSKVQSGAFFHLVAFPVWPLVRTDARRTGGSNYAENLSSTPGGRRTWYDEERYRTPYRMPYRMC